MIELLFLIVWSALGLTYYVSLWMRCVEFSDEDKERLVILLAGPAVWMLRIGVFVWMALKPLFEVFDGWVTKG